MELTVDSVVSALNSSASIREALQKLGLRDSSAYYKKLKRFCEINQIEYKAISNRKGRVYVPTLNWLVENSPASNSVLKKRLVDEGFLEYRCYGNNCSVIDTWNGKPITLHLEHINGSHNDNRIENLILLCPNCHTQTETYAVAKTHPRVSAHLCSCGAVMSKAATVCSSCYGLNRPTKTKYPELDELQVLVKTHGFRGTGKILGVSDNAVRKRIKTLTR